MSGLERLNPGKGRRGRQFNTRAPRRSFLIVCEGEVTEVRYFEAFPVRKEVLVAVRGEGKNTTSLVEAAVRHADRAEAAGVVDGDFSDLRGGVDHSPLVDDGERVGTQQGGVAGAKDVGADSGGRFGEPRPDLGGELGPAGRARVAGGRELRAA